MLSRILAASCGLFALFAFATPAQAERQRIAAGTVED